MFNSIIKKISAAFGRCCHNATFKHNFVVHEYNNFVDVGKDRYDVIPRSDSYGVMIEFVNAIAEYYGSLYKFVDVVISYRRTNVGQQIYDGFEGHLNDSYTVFVDVTCNERLDSIGSRFRSYDFNQWIKQGNCSYVRLC